MANSHQIPDIVPFSEGTRPKLIDQVRHAIRMRHYSRRTEKTYADWIRRFIIFHHKKHPKTMGAPEITAFLSWLATTRRVSASTQNQALSAVLFLYRHVLRIEVDAIEQVPRARLPDRVPVVLSREEVDQIFALFARPEPRRAWRSQSVRPAVRVDCGVSREWLRPTAPGPPHRFEPQPTHAMGFARDVRRSASLRSPRARAANQGACGQAGGSHVIAIRRTL